MFPFIIILIITSLFFTACEEDFPTQASIKPYDFASLDEAGGKWKPILLSSVTEFAVSTPESVSSQAYQNELAELKSIIGQRTAAQEKAAEYWGSNALIRWNEIALALSNKYNLIPPPNPDGTYTLPDPANPGKVPNFPFSHPPYTSRALSYWGAAQFDALIAAWHYKYQINRPAPYVVDNTIQALLPDNNLPSYPSEDAIIAAVSQSILTAMFPLEKDYLEEKAAEHRNSRLWAGMNVESDLIAGDSLGRAVAAKFLARAKTDGMSKAQAPKPISDSLTNAAKTKWNWHWENLELPKRPVGLTPLFGQVKMWCVPNVEAVRPVPPPAPGTPAFEKDAKELREIAKNLTTKQRKIANFWADGLNTYTPPGHWNRLASDFIVKYQQNPLRAARTFAYLNMAEMDAGIACWDAKYYYHYPRPSQAIPGFKTILGIPNFPSYTSGHSTFSAAAATVLSHIFPNERAYCEAWAEEAAMSRVYAGIHYRFDAEVGLTQGQAVGEYVISRAKTDGAE
ncbi:MAG: phosphatase PAP2 family protein [Saprospiraceae bacterium]|nr:phosphatase PAP2 family protein [Saprospiraceae bacterium]